mgnify:CR=1 FL=1
MRGTAFFELYYTYDMLDEGDKWYISSDVLSWAERNFDTLQHSQIFGGRPGIGEFYGFSAWNETNGVIGLRNPGTETVKETINLDRNIGVPEAIGTVYRCTLLDHQTKNDDEVKNKEPFKYGDELKVTLVPGEYRIYEFRPNYDQDPPQVEVIKSTKENEIMLRFNKELISQISVFAVIEEQLRLLHLQWLTTLNMTYKFKTSKIFLIMFSAKKFNFNTLHLMQLLMSVVNFLALIQ